MKGELDGPIYLLSTGAVDVRCAFDFWHIDFLLELAEETPTAYLLRVVDCQMH